MHCEHCNRDAAKYGHKAICPAFRDFPLHDGPEIGPPIHDGTFVNVPLKKESLVTMELEPGEVEFPNFKAPAQRPAEKASLMSVTDIQCENEDEARKVADCITATAVDFMGIAGEHIERAAGLPPPEKPSRPLVLPPYSCFRKFAVGSEEIFTFSSFSELTGFLRLVEILPPVRAQV